MKKIYMYPKNDYETLESPNPYVINVENSLAQKHIIVNTKPNNKGVVDLFFYLFKANIFFFNWIEDIPVKKFGKIQCVLFPLFLLLTKIFNKKIVWVLHNKLSHERINREWIKFIFLLMIKNSDLIITHSTDGVNFINEKAPKYSNKVKYIIHPVEELFPVKHNTPKKYDFLIWGTIHPYKGVIEFLEFVLKTKQLKEKKILISGICPHIELKKKLLKYINENIDYRDGFFDISEIANLANQSKYILFTYNSESILSSGSLMDSIRMGSIIIGPDKGAFKDLKIYSFIKTYSSFREIAEIIKNIEDKELKSTEIENFCKDNSWNLFAEKLFNISEGIL